MSDQSTTQQILAATNNAHKVAEIRPLLEPDFRLLNLADVRYTEELPETGDTLDSNAFEKAKFVFDKFSITCFADDTGLEVEALDGAPGVYSARFAGPEKDSPANIELLLNRLKGQHNRRARFRTVIALVGPGIEEQFEGIVTGTILESPRGAGGFGYDPVFLPDGQSKSMAELTLEEKNAISHRGKAVEKLVAWLKNNATS